MLEQLKAKNTADLLLYLLAHGAATKSEMVRGTSLGNSTVSDAINYLIDMDLVCSIGKEDSIGGRRAIIYNLNKEYGRFLGIVYNADNIDFILTDCHSNVVKSWTISNDPKVPALYSLLNELRRVMCVEKNVLGIGIGLHGRIDYESQIVISCDYLGWHYVPLKEIVERDFRTVTVIDHCVNGIAQREKLLGKSSELRNFIYYTDLAPQKMAIILDGCVSRGKNNMTGKIDDPQADFFRRLPELRESLDVEKIIVATNKANKIISELNAKDVVVSDANLYDLAIGMATSAQITWFSYVLGRKGV